MLIPIQGKVLPTTPDAGGSMVNNMNYLLALLVNKNVGVHDVDGMFVQGHHVAAYPKHRRPANPLDQASSHTLSDVVLLPIFVV
ncbi:MAG: hypothetical protein QXR26_08675 [Candidatus Caldarchaeum sp.]